MRIMADSSSLLSPADGATEGIRIVPVSVAVGGETFRDYVDISSEGLLERIAAGGAPTTSQPSVGDMLEAYEESGEDTVFLTVGDGLSGAYQTAEGARALLENREAVRVVDSRTLAAPLRYLARKAVALKEKGHAIDEVILSLQKSIDSSLSFVIPADFEFLKRSGRVTGMVARVGGVLKLLPILTQTEDKKRIRPITVKRSWRAAVGVILERMALSGVGENHLISVCHAGTLQRAQEALQQVRSAFPRTETELAMLPPSLITHGGPGCLVIQSILK